MVFELVLLLVAAAAIAIAIATADVTAAHCYCPQRKQRIVAEITYQSTQIQCCWHSTHLSPFSGLVGWANRPQFLDLSSDNGGDVVLFPQSRLLVADMRRTGRTRNTTREQWRYQLPVPTSYAACVSSSVF